MTSTNLTYAEAAARSSMITGLHYSISLDLTGSERTFVSTTDISMTVTKAGDTFLDLRADKVHEVTLDGVDITANAVPLAHHGYDEQQGLQLRGLTPGEHAVRVVADAVYSRTGQGLHRFVDPADGEVYMYTQFETADAKRVFACFDQPDMKATYSMSVTAPADWKVISNPEMTAIASPTVPGARVHTGEVDYLLSTYLVAFCVGPYAEFTDSWTGTLTHHKETPADQPTELTVPFGIYCRKSLAAKMDAERLFEQTKQGFDYYHAHFGMAYPFKKYDQVFCPEYNMGAMENAGCVTFRDEYVFDSRVTRQQYERRCDTVEHELAHMWFGDLVTMKWWGDLWLNESFATWSSAMAQSEATEYTTAWVTFTAVDKLWAYAQDQLPTTHPIFSDASDIETVEQNFDGITYAKGASVLKQLQAYVGREEFFAGVRQHFAAHAFGNATFDDLLGALEKASGRDLHAWADQWLKTTGINHLGPKFEVKDGAYSSFGVYQTGAAPGAGETRVHRTAVGLYSFEGDKLVRTHKVELDVEGEYTEVPQLVGVAEADLVLVNDEDLAYCIMDLDKKSLATVVENLEKIEDPMARALVWAATYEMVRDGKLKAREFIRLVNRAARHETEVAVLTRLMVCLSNALRSYTDPTWLEQEGYAATTAAMLQSAQEAQPGSDQQLAFSQIVLGLPLTDASTAFAHGILNEDSLDGLELDADLRWRALVALAASGDLGDKKAVMERVAEERQRDTSSTGRNYAWRVEAAINTPENKREIFTQMFTGGKDMSNLELRHKGMGLVHPGAEAALLPLTAAYFDGAKDVWDTFESEVALRTLSEVYPRWDISQAAIDRATALLEQDHPAGLKRIIMEGKDTVERALRLRAFDAS